MGQVCGARTELPLRGCWHFWHATPIRTRLTRSRSRADTVRPPCSNRQTSTSQPLRRPGCGFPTLVGSRSTNNSPARRAARRGDYHAPVTGGWHSMSPCRTLSPYQGPVPRWRDPTPFVRCPGLRTALVVLRRRGQLISEVPQPPGLNPLAPRQSSERGSKLRTVGMRSLSEDWTAG